MDPGAPLLPSTVLWSARSQQITLIGELVFTAFLVAYAAGVTVAQPSWASVYVRERDSDLSAPLLEDTVPTRGLVAFVTGIPSAAFVLGHGGMAWRARRDRRALLCVLVSALFVALSYMQANAAQAAVTYTLKPVVARPRPNFFAYCNYAGYHDAVRTGNFSSYLAATTPDAIGSMAKCTASRRQMYESIASFPSGHASYSFGALFWTTLYLRTVLGIPWHEHMTLPAAVSASPLVLALWISVTRLSDRFHFIEDTMTGAVLGVVCTLLAWIHLVNTPGRFIRPSLAACGAGQRCGEVSPSPTPSALPPAPPPVHRDISAIEPRVHVSDERTGRLSPEEPRAIADSSAGGSARVLAYSGAEPSRIIAVSRGTDATGGSSQVYSVEHTVQSAATSITVHDTPPSKLPKPAALAIRTTPSPCSLPGTPVNSNDITDPIPRGPAVLLTPSLSSEDFVNALPPSKPYSIASQSTPTAVRLSQTRSMSVV